MERAHNPHPIPVRSREASAPRRYSVPLVLLAAVLLIAWLGSTGSMQIYTGWLYDIMVRHSGAGREETSRVLLIESRSPNPDGGKWAVLVEQLYTLGARRVAFSFLPRPLPSALVEQARKHPGMVFARRPRHDPRTGILTGLEPWPAALAQAGALPAIQTMPPDELGIRRRQPRFIELDGGALPTLPQALAIAEGRVPSSDQPFLVNFLDGGMSLPVYDLQRALDGGLVRSLVGDRIVIIGFARHVREAGLHTPASGADRSVSLLQYTGQALDTLLRGKPVRELPLAAILALYLAIVSLFLWIYQTLPVRVGAWLTPGVILLYLLAAWLLLAYARLWLPVVEMSLLQLATYAAVFVRKAAREEQLIRRALLDTRSRLRQRVIPASFFDSDEPWRYVANLLNQTLELHRMIFLEKVEGDHRVREVHALNCGLDDIHEQRRDYHRTPYSTAIATNAPVRVERDYLKRHDQDEVQYLVPLTFAGEVLGFWAFGVHPDKISHEENFIGLAGDFSVQIAEMLYHRQRWREEQLRRESRLRRYLRAEGWDETHREFSDSLALLDKRLSVLEQVFDGMGNASILYDLFGRVLQVNQRMEAMMKRARLHFYDMTAIDMIAAVCGDEQTRVREYLHRVVVDRARVDLPAPGVDSDNETYMLNIRPLVRTQQRDKGGRNTGDEPAPFQISGILIELVDISSFRKLNDLRVRMLERMDEHLQRDFGTLLDTAGRISRKSRDPACADAGDIMGASARHALYVLEEVRRYLYFSFEETGGEAYPVDAIQPLNAAIEAVEDGARHAGVRFRPCLPEQAQLVMACPQELTEAFSEVLRVLVSDAMADSELHIEVEPEPDRVRYRFSNAGFGIPPERLQEYLHDEVEVSVDEFRGLRTANRRIRSWGGSLRAETSLGQGMQFEIELRGFL